MEKKKAQTVAPRLPRGYVASGRLGNAQAYPVTMTRSISA